MILNTNAVVCSILLGSKSGRIEGALSFQRKKRNNDVNSAVAADQHLKQAGAELFQVQVKLGLAKLADSLTHSVKTLQSELSELS